MSKTIELARHLERLHINNMYKSDFYWTWDKTDEELEAIFTVADALRDLRERNKSTRIFDSGLGISIFRDNSTRTRFSFASACNLLGLRHPGRYVHRRGPQISENLHGRAGRGLSGWDSGAASHAGKPPVRRGSPHSVHGRYAPHHPSVRRRGEPEGQEDCHDMGLLPLLRQAPLRASGRHRPDDPLRHGRGAGPSRRL